MYKKIFNRLPERFRKSNTDKLYYVLFDEKGAFLNAINSVEDSRNIDNATGDTLDLIGGNVGQIRQGEDDDLFRQLIKVRILANMSIGDIETINTIMSTLVKETYLGLREAFLYDKNLNEPAAIVLDIEYGNWDIPYYVVDKIKAAGVRVLYATNVKHHLYWAGVCDGREHITKYPYSLTEIDYKNNMYIGTLMAVTEYREMKGVD